MEQWRQVEEFPDYEVSDQGIVRRVDNGKVLKTTANQSGHLMVTLFVDHAKRTRLVGRLVAQAFVDPEFGDHFNSVIYLDNDVTNCRADNLMWRPRWFAINYRRQFKEDLADVGPVYLRDTDETFDNVREAAMKYGLLENRLRLGLREGETCYPGNLDFRYA